MIRLKIFLLVISSTLSGIVRNIFRERMTFHLMMFWEPKVSVRRQLVNHLTMFSVIEEMRISMWAFPFMAVYTLPFNYLGYFHMDNHYDNIEVKIALKYNWFLKLQRHRNTGFFISLWVHSCSSCLLTLVFTGFIEHFIILFFTKWLFSFLMIGLF